MRHFCVALLIGFSVVGGASAATIVQDQFGALRLYADPAARSEFQGSADSSLVFPAASSPAVDVDLNAKISPESVCESDPCVPCVFKHYRTYYKPGEIVDLWATWRPYWDWGVNLDGNELVITITLKKGSKVLYSDEWNKTLSENSADSGVGFTYMVPETAKAGDVYTLEVALSVSGINAVDRYKPTPSRTKLYVVEEDSVDLPIPLLNEFEQRDWRWGQDPLGMCRTTMAKEGGATTSKAFVFAYYSYPTYLAPGELNECLTASGGYVEGCDIPRDNANKIALRCAPEGVSWDGYYAKPHLSARIESSLSWGFPVIAEAVQSGDLHYYAIVGRRGVAKWNVFDPLDGQIHTMESRGLTNSMIRAVYLYSQE